MTPKRTTEDLIRNLAARPAPGPLSAGMAVGAMGILVAAALGLFWLVFGLRPNLLIALQSIPVQAKSALPLLLCGTAAWLALASLRPGARIALWPLAAPLFLGLLLVIMRILTGPDGAMLSEMIGNTALACLTSITLLSILPMAVGVLMLRRGAPTRPAVTGALVGLAAGAAVAAGYALHCTEDSPLFFVLWYGLGIALVASLGGLFGNRVLRW